MFISGAIFTSIPRLMIRACQANTSSATNCVRFLSIKLVARNAAHRAMLANEPLGFGRIDLGEQHGMHRRDLGWRPPTGPQATLLPSALEALGDCPPLLWRLFITGSRHCRS